MNSEIWKEPDYTVIPHFIYIQIMLYSAELKRGTA